MTWGAPLPAPNPACLGEVMVRGSKPSSSCRLCRLCLRHMVGILGHICSGDESVTMQYAACEGMLAKAAVLTF